MTVGDKMHKALNNLRGCVTDFKDFALATQDKNAQQMYANYAEQIDNIVTGFESRVNQMESEEPEYKVYKNMQGNQSNTNDLSDLSNLSNQENLSNLRNLSKLDNQNNQNPLS